jgi:uncharacterized protein with FMN-binding domain
MSRKARNILAQSAIIAATVAGGLVMTEHFAPANSAVAAVTSSQGQAAAADKTVTSVDVPYQFGDIQLTVTRKSGKISAIDYGASSATGGREQAFPMLVQSALAAQGSNFGNLSGATYTTDAFKQALDSAISKLG